MQIIILFFFKLKNYLNVKNCCLDFQAAFHLFSLLPQQRNVLDYQWHVMFSVFSNQIKASTRGTERRANSHSVASHFIQRQL